LRGGEAIEGGATSLGERQTCEKGTTLLGRGRNYGWGALVCGGHTQLRRGCLREGAPYGKGGATVHLAGKRFKEGATPDLAGKESKGGASFILAGTKKRELQSRSEIDCYCIRFSLFLAFA
jgi:hypothetical protein